MSANRKLRDSVLQISPKEVNFVIDALKPLSPFGMNKDLAMGCLGCASVYFVSKVSREEMHKIVDFVWDWLVEVEPS